MDFGERKRAQRNGRPCGFVELLAYVVVFTVAGCASLPGGMSSKAFARHLPSTALVDDGHGSKVHFRLNGLVDRGRFTSGFGRRNASGGSGSAIHQGLDIAAPSGTPVRASAAGVVAGMTRHGNYGRLLRIRHSDHLETAYAHLSGFAPNLSVGQAVKQGQTVGYVGTSGRTTGPHLHFEIRRRGEAIDPLAFPSPVSRTGTQR